MASVTELVVKVVTDTSRATGLDDTAAKTSKFKAGMAKASAVAGAALLAVGAAAISAGKAAAEDAQSQAVLANAMQNSAGASKASIAATEDYIAKMSLATGVADDELRPAMGNLVRATGDVATSQKALGQALDISAATGKSVESVSQALAKAYGGQTTSLGKLVPGMDKAVLATGDMDKIMAELARTTGGAAAASANTAAGKMQRMTVAMNEAQESVGTALLPAMSAFATVLGKVAIFAGNNAKTVQILAGVLAGLAAAVLVVNAALRVYEATLLVVQAVQKATWLSNPIGLVVVAVIALVAAMVLLYKKSATVRRVVDALWDGIKRGAKVAGDVVKAVWRVVWAAASAYVRVYATIIRAVFTGILAVSRAVGSAVRQTWSAVWSALRSGARALADAVKAALGAVRDAVGWVVDRLQSLVDWLHKIKVPAGLAAPFTAIGDAIDSVIDKVQDLVGWLGRIKVPHISLPKIPGVGRAAPAPAVAGFAAPQVTSRGALGAAPTSRTVAAGGSTFIINGALDPEAVARQIARIQGRHTTRVGSRGRGLRAT